MPKKNQLADLRRLISLNPKDMRREAPRYIYEKPDIVLKLLFGLIYSERLNHNKKENILTLMKYILEKHFQPPLPEWLLQELNKMLKTDRLSGIDKAVILSAFEPEELIDRLDGFDEFIEEFTDYRESFEDFILEQLIGNRSRLYEIHKVIIEKSHPDALLGMIEDLVGAEDEELLSFFEILTYHESPDVRNAALKAIEIASTQQAVETLYSISRLNKKIGKVAEESYISLMHELPEPINDEIPGLYDDTADTKVTLVDGNGAMSVYIGKRFARNSYMFASVLLKLSDGIKDIVLLTNLTKEAFDDIKREYISALKYFSVPQPFLIKLINHFLKQSDKRGKEVPREFIILKNMLKWKGVEPTEYYYAQRTFEPLEYSPRDLKRFPLESWWLYSEDVFELLKPYKDLEPYEIPEDVYLEISELYLDFAKNELVPISELCIDIIENSNYKNYTRLKRLLQTIREEIINEEYIPSESEFINFQTFRTVYFTLKNLSMGFDSPEY